jgi:hypothetical protein
MRARSLAALIISATCLGCAPSLVSLKASMPQLAPPAQVSAQAFGEFPFPQPDLMPDLPVAHAVRCPGYAACFDAASAAALHRKIDALRADDIYMRSFYANEVAAYRSQIDKESRQ